MSNLPRFRQIAEKKDIDDKVEEEIERSKRRKDNTVDLESLGRNVSSLRFGVWTFLPTLLSSSVLEP